MANERPKDTTVSLGDNISLDQLISATSTSVLRALKEHERQENRFEFNPRIWVGIWVDLDRFRFPGGGPGGGPVGGGGGIGG